MIKQRLITIALLLALLAVPVTAFASDISGARFWALIVVSNNNTAETNVATTANISTQSLITGNYLNSSANNCVIRTSSGADVLFMPGYNSVSANYPWSMWVPFIGNNAYLSYLLYTAESTGGDIRYFPGSAGMSVTDDASLEISDNGSMSISAYIDTSASMVGENIINKPGAIRLYIGATGNITATVPLVTDNFSSDSWTDVGAGIGVNVGNSRMEWDTTNNVEHSYKIMPYAVSDTVFQMEMDWRVTTTAASSFSGVGITDAPNGDWGTPAGDAIFFVVSNLGLYGRAWNGGAGVSTAAIAVLLNTTYYITLERVSATSLRLNVYTDSARTTHTAGSPQSVAMSAGTVGLDTLEVAGYNTGNQNVGWLDSLYVSDWLLGADAIVSEAGVTSGEHDIEVSANVTHLRLYRDNILKQSIAFKGVPDYANDWEIGGDATPYIESANITVDGVLRGSWEWEYSENFTDLSGNGNLGYPSFRTSSSDPHVSAEMVSFQAISEAQAPSYVLSAAPDFIDASALTAQITAPFTITPPAGTFPLAGVIAAVANATSTPAQLPLLTIAVFVIIAASLTMSALLRKYGSGTLIAKMVVIVAFMGIFIALTDWGIDFWMLCVFLVIAIALTMASKQVAWS